MRPLYYLATRLYHGAIRLAALGNDKARQWVEGRRNWKADLRRWRHANADSDVIWMHCASLGEFEQGRPVLERLRADYPQYKFVLTFYSPSGFEMRKNYPGADYIAYLPPLELQQVPAVLIAAHFRPDQVFFRKQPGSRFFQGMLQSFTHLFVQNEATAALLPRAGVSAAKVTVAGDPRVDRVIAITREAFADERLEAFARGAQLLIAGSTWPTDEERLLEVFPELPSDWKLLLVPHDVNEDHVSALYQSLPLAGARYSRVTAAEAATQRILILDTIGLLNRVYRLGRIAYIGGGFGAGIHNTLEPAAYGLPVIFGPRYGKFPEARTLIERGGGFCMASANALRQVLARLREPGHYRRASAATSGYIAENKGSTERIVEKLQQLQLLG